MTKPHQHPAKFAPEIIEAIREVAHPVIPRGARVLDPFAGTGRIHWFNRWDTWGLEIEPEWASMHPQTIVGDATRMPFEAGAFLATVTSPCYANRMADHHDAKERCRECRGTGLVHGTICEKCGGAGKRSYRRNTYTHTLGRKLHERNTGTMQWGKAYRAMHTEAWTEMARVTTEWMVLNISDHIRKGVLVPVTDWHVSILNALGFVEVERLAVPTKRNRQGENHHLRADHEDVILMRKVGYDARQQSGAVGRFT